MGEAKRRGSFEQRQAEGIKKCEEHTKQRQQEIEEQRKNYKPSKSTMLLTSLLAASESLLNEKGDLWK